MLPALGILQVSLESKGKESFKTPRGVCVPFGSMELALAQRPAADQQRFAALLAASETAGLAELDAIADEMQVRHLALSDRARGSVVAHNPAGLEVGRSASPPKWDGVLLLLLAVFHIPAGSQQDSWTARRQRQPQQAPCA
jgi:hypothetical protein